MWLDEYFRAVARVAAERAVLEMAVQLEWLERANVKACCLLCRSEVRLAEVDYRDQVAAAIALHGAVMPFRLSCPCGMISIYAVRPPSDPERAWHLLRVCREASSV